MGNTPPDGAIVLFDSTNGVEAFTTRKGSPALWLLHDDGSVRTNGGDIASRERFVDFYLHLEFWCNDSPPDVKGQGRANSGVFLQGRYELQVLDSWNIDHEPGKGDCGALYNYAAPLVNASRPPEQWQTYDVFFRAPRFAGENGAKTENARVTALQNGLVIHNNVELPRQTGAAFDENYEQPGPLLLQDHGNDVRYRNIWIAPLHNQGADFY